MTAQEAIDVLENIKNYDDNININERHALTMAQEALSKNESLINEITFLKNMCKFYHEEINE